MSVSREELTRRVHATRRWLEKAEESFRNRSTVKGELNLMLAQAEWQKLREQRGGGWRPAYWQQGAALLLAAIAAMWLLGMWPPASDDTTRAPVTTVPVVREVPTSLVLPQVTGLERKSAAPVAAEPVVTTVSEAPASEPAAVVTVAAPLSQAELNSVVSDAGKVLRGQA